jgi:uncharacterized membrane protein
MVVVETNNGYPQLILTPNRSANWVQTKHLLYVLAGTSLGIATAWSFLGAWVILPFAGFEVGLLAFLMHRVCFATYQQQVIRLQNNDVFIQLGVYKPARGWRLNKACTRVIVTEPQHPDDPIGLSIKDDQYTVELGAFLSVDDKQYLLDELKLCGLETINYGKTVQVGF